MYAFSEVKLKTVNSINNGDLISTTIVQITTECRGQLNCKQNKQNIGKVKNICRILWEIVYITTIDYNNYNVVAWIAQSLFFVLCVWGACEWMDASKQNKS